MNYLFRLLVSSWTTPQFKLMYFSASELRSFALTTASADGPTVIVNGHHGYHVIMVHSSNNQINDLLYAVHSLALELHLPERQILCVQILVKDPMANVVSIATRLVPGLVRYMP